MYVDKEKQKEYQRNWILKRRNEFFSGKVCVSCGSGDNLQLDHIEPGEKTTHRIWSFSQKRREDEIQKCQILCGSCHRKKTNSDNGFGMEHGTSKGYLYYGCRCRPCTDTEVKRVNDNRRKRYSRMAKR